MPDTPPNGPPSRAGRPTIRDVAREAQVSVSTVSFALNGKGSLAQSTRDRVLAIAERMGYEANPMARGLRGSSSRILGVSIRPLDLGGAYRPAGVDHFSRMVGAAATTALDNGYGMMLVGHSVANAEYRAPLWVDGYVIEDPVQDDEFVSKLLEAQVPFVTIGWDPDRKSSIPWVSTSDTAETKRILTHLQERGATSIVMVSGTERTSWHIDGEKAYVAWMKAAGQEPKIIHVPEAEGVAGGKAAIAGVISGGETPSAIYCQTGRHAVGAALAAQDAGLQIPSDILIAAGSDSEAARTFTPAITTIDLKPEELGRRAVELLIHNLNSPNKRRSDLVYGELVVRQSTLAGLRSTRKTAE